MSPRSRSAWAAAGLTLLCTGLGHLYLGRTVRGLTLFLLSLLTAPAAILVAVSPPSDLLLVLLAAVFLAAPALLLFALVDGVRIALKRDEAPRREYQRLLVYVLFAAVGILYPVGSTLLIRSHYLAAYRIASGSMEPTLHRGDRVLVSKTGSARRGVRAGDVVVFRPPAEPDRNYVKRIVGLPGDRIEALDGRILRNGEPWSPAPASEEGAPAFPEVTVPPGCYFLLGDAAGNSRDSRQFGCVPGEDLVGRVVYVLGSDRIGVFR